MAHTVKSIQAQFEQHVTDTCRHFNIAGRLRELRSGFNTETKTGFLDYALSFDRNPAEQLLKKLALDNLVAEDAALDNYRGQITYRVSRVRVGPHVLDFPAPKPAPKKVVRPTAEDDEEEDARPARTPAPRDWFHEVTLNDPGTPI